MSFSSAETVPQGVVQAMFLHPDAVLLLDQTALPREVRYTKITTADEMRHAIQTMIVRGAPAIGVAGAYGVVLSGRQHLSEPGQTCEKFVQLLLADADLLSQARPTAVNLQWAIDRLKTLIQRLADASETPQTILQKLEAEAQTIYEEDLAMCHAIGQNGAALVPKSARILTYCNAGALATAGYGTALGVVRSAFETDPTLQVIACETRPRLQGARLTSWEMVQENIPVTLITDNMSAWLMKQGRVDLVVVGADRIAANGDTANKIGTYLLAIAAKRHNIPFYVAAPSSTIDPQIANGDEIPIEVRPDEEIYWIHDETICPEGVSFYNPAFDVTPAELITAIITEKGVFRFPYHW